jgi:DNA-binding NarL/FixJ family response regulator
MKKITIAIADDQTLFRQALRTLIASVSQFELVAEAENGPSLIDQMGRLNSVPDISLIDMKMPEMNGIELNRILQHDYPETKVIILSEYGEKRIISTMIVAGARSYLQKNCDKDEFVTTITSVQNAGFYINNQILEAIQSSSAKLNKPVKSINEIPFEITRREKEILQLICSEYSNSEIADKLFLSIRTVEGHRNNLILKTGCKNTAGLVLFAIRYNIYNIELQM